MKGGKREKIVLERLCRKCVSKILSTLPKRFGAGVIKETFDSSEKLRCLLSSGWTKT